MLFLYTKFDYILVFLCRIKVAGCAKHYVGDGGTVKGINENNTIVDHSGLFGIHMPAYLDSLAKGVATIMASYSSINGVKMHSNRDLLTGFLKDKLGFKVNPSADIAWKVLIFRGKS